MNTKIVKPISVQSLVNDTFNNFQQIFRHRLVQKLSRPISQQQRIKILQKYRLTFHKLHGNLQKIRVQCSNTTQSAFENNAKTQQKSTKAIKPTNVRNQFRKIQSKYIEIFRQGSFKHFHRIAVLYNLSQNIYLINIDGWLAACLENQNQVKCC